ncbi:GNAT family acetyltransferase [Skermanella stibiiresistens SB22]|uniref:GNAT family acetyltransferase n=1 Tax=Skermanella stibiiresistens SB22 TaxID=1385369 RepID=W9H8K8_9PROT|nr:GNAT family N-acetyltransferase [Skermanella stibiiresistens]EWY41022.1 GNAT family acetyltransferase [Skermanella stibiiresistens SB22]
MSDIQFRRATLADVPVIVALLADDHLGKSREDTGSPLNPGYAAAFEAIDRDPNQMLTVVERGGQVIGCLQITFIPGLSRLGMLRGQVESVRIAAGYCGGGMGRTMLEWAIAECRSRGCGVVQLTTDKSRSDAKRFYEQLGFVASHEGMKLAL